MTLSEKLYNLRRKQGLSQETLAEKLNCSRQAISKWENETPNAEMLEKYGILFNVSIDYLPKQDIEAHTSVQPAQKKESNKLLGLGLIISLLGFLSLIVFSVILVFSPETSDKIAQSSTIIIDGTFVVLFISVLFIVLGDVILIKSLKQK